MTTLTVYDPPMCCSTGICGTDIDQRLVDFAADLDWLKGNGVNVQRINLSQEPGLFAENEMVKSVLEKSGVEGLPVIVADDAIQSSGQYPQRAELAAMTRLTIAAASSVECRPSACCDGSKSDAEKAASAGCCGGTADATEKTSGCC